MSVAPARSLASSPLGRVGREDRERVIAAIAAALPPTEAWTVIAALAGTAEEVRQLPDGLQDVAQVAILAAFPAGAGAVTVSRLGIARVATESWLPQLRERFSGMGVDAVADVLQAVLRHRGELAGPPPATELPTQQRSEPEEQPGGS